MEQGKKVLILYASYGNGHRQVTSALAQRLNDRGVQVVTMDLYKEAYPLLDAVTRFLYMRSFSGTASRIYGWSYYRTRNLDPFREKARDLFAFGLHALRKRIADVQPNAVINTFPFAALPVLKQRSGSAIRTYAVLTDYGLHDLWIHQGLDHIFVATRDLQIAIEQKGISRDRIHVTGIPVHASFRLDARIGLDEGLTCGSDSMRRTILVMAGAFGVLPDTKALCEGLLQIPKVQLIAVCGKNERCRNELQSAFQGNARVKVFGYVQNMAELMAISTCMVTKAGGITLSEAIAMALPVVVYRPMPGQEKENALYLASQGAAILAEHVEQAGSGIRQLLQDERQLHRMKAALHRLQQPDATEAVVSTILADLTQPDVAFNPTAATLAPSSVVT